MPSLTKVSNKVWLGLDKISLDKFVATNVLTREQHELPEADLWEIIREDGHDEAVLMCFDGDARTDSIKFLEDLVVLRAWTDAEGSLYTLPVGGGSAAPKLVADGSSRLRRGRFDVTLVGTGLTVHISSFVFATSRPGNARVFFNVADIHKFCTSRLSRVISAFGCTVAGRVGSSTWRRAWAHVARINSFTEWGIPTRTLPSGNQTVAKRGGRTKYEGECANYTLVRITVRKFLV